MLINIKTRHFHTSINHQEQLFHRTLITSYFCPVNIAKFLRTGFYRTPPEAVACRCSSQYVFLSFANFTGKHLCWTFFLKNLQAQGMQLYLKKTPTKVFSCEVSEIFKNNFFYRTPPVTASALPVADSAFFFKK